mgnify:CR=1 FL=1
MQLNINLPGNYLGGRRRFWTVLNRMMALDLLRVLFTVLFVIVLILVSQEAIKFLDRALQGRIANDTVLSIIALKTIIIGINFLPAASFMSILVVLGRMYRDHEMDVLASAGVGLGQLYKAVLILMLPLSVCAFILSFYTAPWAETKIEQLKFNDQQTVELRGMVAGRFLEYSHGDMVFYIEEIDKDNRMSNIFVQNKRQGTLGVITAQYGSLQDLAEGRFIVLENGRRLQGQPGTVNFIIEKFDKYAFLIKKKGKAIGYHREAIATTKLWLSGKADAFAELQRRLAIPMGIIILSFLAVPLARLAPRGGVYGNIAVAFLIYFSFANIQKFNQGWMLKGNIPVWVGFSWVYLLMLLVLFVLIVKFYGKEWVFGRFKKQISQ